MPLTVMSCVAVTQSMTTSFSQGDVLIVCVKHFTEQVKPTQSLQPYSLPQLPEMLSYRTTSSLVSILTTDPLLGTQMLPFPNCLVYRNMMCM